MGTSHGFERHFVNPYLADLATQTLAPFGGKWQMLKDREQGKEGARCFILPAQFAGRVGARAAQYNLRKPALKK
jgi:hypothetical protein